MPIQKTANGGYRWGENGTVYKGPGAKAKAVKQMKAAFASGWKGNAAEKRGK